MKRQKNFWKERRSQHYARRVNCQSEAGRENFQRAARRTNHHQRKPREEENDQRETKKSNGQDEVRRARRGIQREAHREEIRQHDLIGKHVELFGLKTKKWNGKIGLVIEWNEERDLFRVKLLCDGSIKVFKPMNLRYFSDPENENEEVNHSEQHVHEIEPESNPNFGISTSQFHFSRSQNNPRSSTYATFNFTHNNNPAEIEDHHGDLDEFNILPHEINQDTEALILQQALMNSLTEF